MGFNINGSEEREGALKNLLSDANRGIADFAGIDDKENMREGFGIT